jgi:hypothetical protein
LATATCRTCSTAARRVPLRNDWTAACVAAVVQADQQSTDEVVFLVPVRK